MMFAHYNNFYGNSIDSIAAINLMQQPLFSKLYELFIRALF